MKRIIQKITSLRILNKKAKKQDFELEGVGLAVCSVCGAVWSKKSWHHKEKYSEDELEQIKNKAIKKICPACIMEKENLCEGFVTLKNVPEDKKDELLNLIEHIGERAYKNDVLCRISKIEEERNKNIQICVTENQLAVSLGKQIKNAFNSSLDISWPEGDGPVRVVCEFKKE